MLGYVGVALEAGGGASDGRCHGNEVVCGGTVAWEEEAESSFIYVKMANACGVVREGRDG